MVEVADTFDYVLNRKDDCENVYYAKDCAYVSSHSTYKWARNFLQDLKRSKELVYLFLSNIG